jgi:hypothetical protein
MGRHETIRYRDKWCDVCDKQFTPRTGRQVYCSDECRLGISTCHRCSKRFVRTKHTSGFYCSPECWYKAPGKKEKEDRPCRHCGTVFFPRRAEQRFCSNVCRGLASRKPAIAQCERCGGPMKPEARSGRDFARTSVRFLGG